MRLKYLMECLKGLLCSRWGLRAQWSGRARAGRAAVGVVRARGRGRAHLCAWEGGDVARLCVRGGEDVVRFYARGGEDVVRLRCSVKCRKSKPGLGEEEDERTGTRAHVGLMRVW